MPPPWPALRRWACCERPATGERPVGERTGERLETSTLSALFFSVLSLLLAMPRSGEWVDHPRNDVPVPGATRAARQRFLDRLAAVSTSGRNPARREPPAIVYVRNADPKGPMSVFGYDYLVGHLGAEKAEALALTDYSGLRGGGGGLESESQ